MSWQVKLDPAELGGAVVEIRHPVDRHRALLPDPSVCTVTAAVIDPLGVTLTVVPPFRVADVRRRASVNVVLAVPDVAPVATTR